MCKYYITVTFISSRSHEKYKVEQTIMIFLSTHQATNLCFRAVKKTEGVCRAEYNPDVGSTECGTFFTAGPTCLLRPIRQHTPDGTELTSPDTAVEQFQSESQGKY